MIDDPERAILKQVVSEMHEVTSDECCDHFIASNAGLYLWHGPPCLNCGYPQDHHDRRRWVVAIGLTLNPAVCALTTDGVHVPLSDGGADPVACAMCGGAL